MNPTKNSKPDKEDLRNWLKRLQESERAIIVEGINDKKSLVSLGVSADRIFTLNKRAIFHQIELIAEKHKEVIILTDLDKEGRVLYSKLKVGFERNGVKVDRFFREFLFRTDISHIEGLYNYIRKMIDIS